MVVEQNAERAARLLGRHCVVIGDVTESVTLEVCACPRRRGGYLRINPTPLLSFPAQLAGVRHASKILCTVHSSKTALLVAHRLQLFGVADKSMIRCFEDRISRAVQARGAQVFSTSEWLVHDLYKAFPNRKDECILILGVNKLGQRVATCRLPTRKGWKIMSL